MPVITINSDYIIPDIDTHFKVSAGPGAGKTYWLVNHIKNILHNSNKLSISRRVACITFTNIAVETIFRRLGTSSSQVEVSTIHSFLYKHIVKPYASFISEEYGLDISKLDGHDDTILSNYSFLNDWKTKTGQQRIREDNIVITAFKKLRWKFDGDELVVRTPYPFLVGRYPIKNDSYFEYKKMTWEKGVVHHDDVLFFSYQIIKKFPFVSKVLLAKFPYLVVDEFQDSNPIQVKIFNTLGLEGVLIGIIGDSAQSIYKFQGADPAQFDAFNLPQVKDYTLNENRRSSNEIIDTLNSIRTDITQIKFRNETIEKPKIFIGDMTLALREAKRLCVLDKVYTLSRNNITSNAMKAEINGIGLDSKLLDKLIETDSNRNRRNLIHACIKAIAYSRENKFKDAIKVFEKLFNYRTDKLKGKKRALKYITILLERYDDYKSLSLLEFSVFVKENIDSISKVTGGQIKVFYQSKTFKQLSLCVSIPEDLSLHKTIHKAKGDEFSNVLLVLKEENDINFLITPDLINNEEHRINYVALSRAKNKLFISIPTLHNDKKALLNSNFEIINV